MGVYTFISNAIAIFMMAFSLYRYKTSTGADCFFDALCFSLAVMLFTINNSGGKS